MYCSKCGARASDSKTMCGQCGAPLLTQHPPPSAAAPALVRAPELEPFTPSPGPDAPPALRYCGFWRRFWAAIVDLIIFLPFSKAIEIAMGRPPFEAFEWDPAFWGVQSVVTGLSWLYSALLESSRWQATLGQQLMDIRVADRGGRRISFARASGRHFGQLLSFLTLGIGYLMIAFTAKKQALHDVISGCVLIRPVPATRDLATWPVTNPGQPSLSATGAGA
ncbi:MAG: RDD family protein [Candidatus Eisenbacteria bacterium]